MLFVFNNKVNTAEPLLSDHPQLSGQLSKFQNYCQYNTVNKTPVKRPIYDEPLLSGQPLLSGHLPFPRRWPLNRGWTVYEISYI